MTDKMNNQLITLSRDGTVISTLTDLEFNWEYVQHGLHVTEMGQVLLCGGLSNSIVQVDRDGKQKTGRGGRMEDECRATNICVLQ